MADLHLRLHAILVPTDADAGSTQKGRKKERLARESSPANANFVRSTPEIRKACARHRSCRLPFCSFAILFGTRWHMRLTFADPESQGFSCEVNGIEIAVLEANPVPGESHESMLDSLRGR
jgi:hypothetical protein